MRLFSRKLKKRVLIKLLLVATFIWLLKLLFTPSTKPPQAVLSLDKRDSFFDYIRRSKLKSIQLYTPYFQNKDWANSLGEEPFRKCQESRCFAFRLADDSSSLKNEKNQWALEESDGVIVHVLNLLSMPSRHTYKRRTSQLWSFYTLEPQRLTYCLKYFNLNDLDDWFNLTYTPKSHRHVYSGFDLKRMDEYAYYFEMFNVARLFQLLAPFSNGKKKKGRALWLVSNCDTFNDREEYVNELAKYFEIDVYGSGSCQDKIKNYKKDPCFDSAFGKGRLYKF